ncbi:hypothetical protein N8198_08435 [Gammaproteobacteria bacterium]|nr:hypothetical protein [Gammaproteobacteria bacterium]
MKYKVESTENEVRIEVSGTRGKQKKLLEAFQECQEGRCTCPTREYSKLDSLEIETGEDTIKLKLKSKPDVKFDDSEISKCLEHTKRKVTSAH